MTAFTARSRADGSRGSISERNGEPCEPPGTTVTPNGDPWFAEMAASKIAVLQLK